MNGFGGHRRDALWEVETPRPSEPDLFEQAAATETPIRPLAPMDPGERLQADYDGMNLTTGPHAMALLRPHLPPGVWRAADLAAGRGRAAGADRGQRDLPAASRHGAGVRVREPGR